MYVTMLHCNYGLSSFGVMVTKEDSYFLLDGVRICSPKARLLPRCGMLDLENFPLSLWHGWLSFQLPSWCWPKLRLVLPSVCRGLWPVQVEWSDWQHPEPSSGWTHCRIWTSAIQMCQSQPGWASKSLAFIGCIDVRGNQLHRGCPWK